MGLDMYLTRKTYAKNWDHMTPEERHEITVKLGGKTHPTIKPSRICYVEEQMGYWRKANAIHAWFVRNVQDGKDECQESYVEPKQLQALLELCEECLKDKSQARHKLPTQSGFFFGSTEYDEWYFQDLEHTVKILKACLEEPSCGDFYYRASW